MAEPAGQGANRAIEKDISRVDLLSGVDCGDVPHGEKQAPERQLEPDKSGRIRTDHGATVCQIPLGPTGLFALIDAEDLERAKAFKRHVKRKRSQPGKLYAQRTTPRVNGKNTTESLHRFIMGAEPGDTVDHINGDGLGNRRANLRKVTVRENSTNVTRSKNQKKGGYKGVSWNGNAGKWQASICAGEVKPNGKRKQLYLGLFDDPVDAAVAYDRVALEKFGEFAALNFPKTSDFEFALGGLS